MNIAAATWRASLWIALLAIPVPSARGNPPAPMETMVGCVMDGQWIPAEPFHFGWSKSLPIVPCANIPFDFEKYEGKRIRAEAGIDLYNGILSCPTRVEIPGPCEPGPNRATSTTRRSRGSCPGSTSCTRRIGAAHLRFDPMRLPETCDGDGLRRFLIDLEKTVNALDWDSLMENFIDPGYIDEQLGELPEGDPQQFLYELLFPGLGDMDRLAPRCRNILDAERKSFGEKLSLIRDFAVVDVGEEILVFRFHFGDGICVLEHTATWHGTNGAYTIKGGLG
jgi:hypothetical protein